VRCIGCAPWIIGPALSAELQWFGLPAFGASLAGVERSMPWKAVSLHQGWDDPQPDRTPDPPGLLCHGLVERLGHERGPLSLAPARYGRFGNGTTGCLFSFGSIFPVGAIPESEPAWWKTMAGYHLSSSHH